MRLFLSNRGRFLSLFLVLIIGTAISIGLFFFVREWEVRRLAYEFRLRANDRVTIIEDAIQDHVDVTSRIVDFYAASQSVARQEFETFTRGILRDHPDILAFDWIPRVPLSQRVFFEEQARAEGLSDYRIRENRKGRSFVAEEDRPEYFPIYFIVPLEANRFLLGYDEGSDADRRRAIEKARDTGRPVATGRIRLFRAQPGGFGCRVFFPIYRKDSPIATPDQRRENLRGLVSVLFHIGHVSENAISKLGPEGIAISIYDTSANRGEQLLYTHSVPRGETLRHLRNFSLAAGLKRIVFQDYFFVADKKWSIVCRPTAAFFALQNKWQPTAVLLGGIFLTLLLGFYVYNLISREAEIRSQVESRTIELRQASEHLQKAKDYAELLLNVVPSAVFAVDKNRCVTSFNRRAEELTGYSAQEILGRECTIFAIEPCEYKCNVFAPEVIKPIVAKECLIRHKNGKVLLVSKGADVIRGANGEIIGAIESFEDITERRRAEAALEVAAAEWQKTFDAITDLIFIQNNEHEILRVNASFAKAMGKSPQELVGKKCYELVHGLGCPWPECPMEQTRKDNLPHTVEVNDPHIGVPLLVTTSPIFNDQGRLVGSVHIAKDITEFKKAEEQIRKAAELKVTFTSMVSHELRTPLTAIKEGISILIDGVAGEVRPEQREFLEIAKRNVDRLSRLIHNVLDFQKLDSGRMEFYFKDNDLTEVVREVYETMAPLAHKKGLVFDLKFLTDLPRAKFDRDKITQVLSNLVNNAIKFTETGSVTLAVEHKDGTLQVWVEDTGPGIRPEDIQRLFRHFEQLESLQERKTGGTGLGLAISRQIIEEHDGQIWVESVFGRGSTFYFSLPINA